MKPSTVSILITCLFSTSVWGQSNWLSQGISYDSSKNYLKAIDCYTQAIKENSSNVIALYNRSVDYVIISKPNLALVDLNQLLSQDTTLKNAYYNRYSLQHQFGNLDFALNDLSKYIQLDNNEINALYLRIDLAIQLEYYDIAIKDLLTLIRMNESGVENKILLAEVYAKAGEIKQAESILNQLALSNENTNDRLYLIRSIILNKSGDYTNSIQYANLYLLNNPKDIGALKLNADNQFYLQEFELALSSYKLIYKQDSNEKKLLNDIGHCYLQLKLYSQAAEILTQSILYQNNEPAYAYLGRGIAYFNLKKYNQACSDWHRSSLLGNTKAKEYLSKSCLKNETK
jgi:tetratricopeptide (TPR) repeat protein